MGAFLAHPKTEKHSEKGGNDESITFYGASSMQGWRQTMEDAHLAIPSLTQLLEQKRIEGKPIDESKLESICKIIKAHGIEDIAVYGVFDGHGSNAVSAWCALEFLTVFGARLADYDREHKADTLPKDANRYGDSIDPEIITPANAFLCSTIQQTFLDIDDRLTNASTRIELALLFERGLKDQEGTETYLHRFLMDGGDARVVDVGSQRYLQLVVKNEDGEGKEEEEGKDEEESTEDKIQPVDDDETTNAASRLTRLNSTDNVATESDSKPAPESPSSSETSPSNEVTAESTTLNKCDSTAEESAPESNEHSRLDHPHPSTPEGSGSTSVVCLIVRGKPSVLITANAGDSRCVLSRGGVAFPLSHDHKPTNPQELSRIHAAGGSVNNGRVDGNLNLSRSLGDLYYKMEKNIPPEGQRITAFPDVRVTPICSSDEFVIIACDGIWDCKTNQEAVDFVKSRLSGAPNVTGELLQSICEELCDECLSIDPIQSEGHGCDNMTVVIVELSKNIRASATVPTTSKVVLYGGGEDLYLGSDEYAYDDD